MSAILDKFFISLTVVLAASYNCTLLRLLNKNSYSRTRVKYMLIADEFLFMYTFQGRPFGNVGPPLTAWGPGKIAPFAPPPAPPLSRQPYLHAVRMFRVAKFHCIL